MRRTLIALLTLAFAPAAYAGAWLQPEGQGLAIAQATYFTSTHYMDGNGDRKAQPRFSKYEIQPYVEYGLYKNLTVGATGFAQDDTQSGKNKFGLADPEIFARTPLWKGESQIVSIQPLVKFASIYGSDGAPRGGSQSTDAELSLLYGANVNLISDRDYVDIRAAYRVRGTSLNDQWQADAALGLQVSEHWQIIPAVRTITSTGIKRSTAFSENGDLDYDLIKAEVTAAYSIDQTRKVQMTAFDHLDGRQTGDGFGVSIGFAQTF